MKIKNLLHYYLPRPVTLLLLLSLSFSIPSALALEAPQGSKFDTRIQRINYNENDVVEINAYPGIATQIMFASGEEILDIASGFSEGWEFVNRRNHLYLKPKSVKGKSGTAIEPFSGKWDTNLIVTTNFRVYSFQLMLHTDKLDTGKIAYRVAFNYPKEEAEKARLLAEEKKIAKTS